MQAGAPVVHLRFTIRPDGSSELGHISTGCEAIWDVDAERFRNQPDLFWQMVDPCDLAGLKASLLEPERPEAAWHGDWHIVTPSGDRKWLRGLGLLERLADGNLAWDCMVQEAAERATSREPDQPNEQRLQLLLDNISCGVVVHDDETHVLDANPAAQRVIGLSLEQMRGKVAVDPAWCFLEEDGAIMPLARYPVSQVLASGAEVNQLVMGVRRPDLPRPVWLQVDAYPVRGVQGQVAQVVVTFADITQLKLAEDQARRLNRALRVLGSGNISLADIRDEATYLNRVCEAVVGAGGFLLASVFVANHDAARTARILAGAGPARGYLDGIELSWDEGLAIGRGPFGSALRTGQTLVNQDWDNNTTFAPWRERAARHGFQSSIALPLKASGEVIGILSLYAAEADAFGPEEVPPLEELAHNISATIDTLRTRQARDLAERASKAKTEFLANMSHEIRTPLNAIVGLNFLLRQDGVTPRQAARLDKIDSASQHLLSVVNDVLDLSKIEAGQVRLEAANFHLSAVLDAVSSIIAESAHAKGLTVDTDADAVPDWLQGDPTRLRQALLNFAGNAVKFTDQGSISIRARLLQADGDELLVKFSVEDTGIGIAPEHLPRMFQAFEQADASTTRVYGGTGLGLAISRRLIALMNGECGVQSQPGAGSTFWFTVRLKRGHGALPAPGHGKPVDAEAALRERHRGKRVLVAEDNPVNREVLVSMLNGVSLDADVAGDGDVAVSMARANAYSIVLMDMQMPVMGGLDATRAIRALPGWQQRPILAFTANAFEEDWRACEAAGMNDFITKPVHVRDLYSTLLRWLDQAAGSAEPG